ncbi:ATP synthase subunit I [uncultured Moraxella sp.]|uniref:ATP synthase subunit I n=1 Tax=uncultured Moraxella sp. TaxID=263769 RepID=UPI0025DAFEAB|nr:ATP synthase subunit I [uncultured Moraxella sp.]
MTQPAKRTHQTLIFQRQRRQSYAVLGVIVIGIIISLVMGDTQHTIAKGMAMGSIVAYIAQSAFTYIAYHTTGARHARQIMLNMYLGQMTKWLITLVGLALTFIYLPTANEIAVIIGYLLMMIAHSVTMFFTKT